MRKFNSIYSIFLFNMIPVAGVLWFNWRVFDMFWFFWLETLVISFFDSIKILFSQYGRTESEHRLNYRAAIKFFIIRFIIFWFYLIFLVVFIGIMGKTSKGSDMFRTLLFQDLVFNLSILLLIIVQINHLVKDFFMEKKHLQTAADSFSAVFDSRQIFMHIAIIVCAFLNMFLSDETFVKFSVTLVFCLLKFFFSYKYHQREEGSLMHSN